MKTATVKEVRDIRKWDGPNGTLYFHSLTFDNGDRGNLAKNAADAIKVGDRISYTIEGDRVKQVRVNNGGRPASRLYGGNKPSTSAMALSYAKDLAVAFLTKSDTPAEKMEGVADRILLVADKFDKWIKERNDAE